MPKIPPPESREGTLFETTDVADIDFTEGRAGILVPVVMDFHTGVRGFFAYFNDFYNLNQNNFDDEGDVWIPGDASHHTVNVNLGETRENNDGRLNMRSPGSEYTEYKGRVEVRTVPLRAGGIKGFLLATRTQPHGETIDEYAVHFADEETGGYTNRSQCSDGETMWGNTRLEENLRPKGIPRISTHQLLRNFTELIV